MNQVKTWGPATAVPIDNNQLIAAPGPLDEALAATLDPIISLQGLLPLDPPTMSVNITTTTPTQNMPSNRGMRGVPPVIFDGMRSHADDFWAQFRRFKMVNRTHKAMVKPYDRILTALTYIHRPLINDWVNGQEQKLDNQVDTTKPNWVCKDNEILWAEFEMAFKNVWTDTSKKQNAYDQLM